VDNLVSYGFDELAPSRGPAGCTTTSTFGNRIPTLGTSISSTSIPVLHRPYVRSGNFQKLYRLKAKAYLFQHGQSVFKDIARCISRLMFIMTWIRPVSIGLFYSAICLSFPKFPLGDSEDQAFNMVFTASVNKNYLDGLATSYHHQHQPF